MLRAKRTVLVRGLGSSLSGRYLVERVRHVIGVDRHRQQLTLVRNALGLKGDESFGGGGLAPVTDRFHGKYLGDRDRQRRPEEARPRPRPGARGVRRRDDRLVPALQSRTPATASGLAAVPPVGSLVFVEWPAGDTTRVPIWSGGAWPDGDGVQDAGPETLVLTTPAGHKVVLRDESGSESIEIEAASGAKVSLSTRRHLDRVREPEGGDDERVDLDQRRCPGGEVACPASSSTPARRSCARTAGR